MTRASTATCCSSKACAMAPRCSGSRARLRPAGNPSLLTNWAARKPLRRWPAPTPALSRAPTAAASLRARGTPRVQMLEPLLEALPLAQPLPLPLFRSDMPPARRVGVVSTTGGGAAMVVDQLGVRGLQVQCPSEATQERLKAAGIPGNAGRVLDLTLAGTRYAVMKAALQILLDAPEFDMLIAVLGSSARLQPQLALQPILDSASHRKPLMAM